MAVTEIALLHLTPPTTAQDPTLQSKLSTAKTVMQDYSGRSFYYLQQVEDASFVYIIGEWDSLDQHMNHFIPSPENQALLESLDGLVTVQWLQHIDVPHAALPLPKGGLGTNVYGITRHFVKEGGKEAFRETFEANKQYLQDYVTEGTIGGGWRVDREEGKDEYVLFMPWTDVEQHLGFAETEGFAKYERIREHIDGADVKHAKLLDI